MGTYASGVLFRGKHDTGTPEACVPASGRFSYFAGFDTAGTDLHSLVAALGLLHPNGLQVRVENSR